MSAEHKVAELSTEDVIRKLEGGSPLQASRTLIDMELYDQQDTLEVLNSLEEELSKSEQGIGSTLIKPIFLSICDGLVAHPKLGLSEKGLTASRLVGEIESFSYSSNVATEFQDEPHEKARLDEHTSQQVDDKGDYNRDKLEDKTRMHKNRDQKLAGNRKSYSELEVNEKGEKRTIFQSGDAHNKEKRAEGKKTSKSSLDIEHIVGLENLFNEYGVSKALTLDDMKTAANQDVNLKNISAELNRSKGSKDWVQYEKECRAERVKLEQKKKDGTLTAKERAKLDKLPTEATLRNALKANKSAKSTIESDLNKAVANNLTKDTELLSGVSKEAKDQASKELEQKGLGELILLIVKPVCFELTDIFHNGVTYNLNASSKLDAIKSRFSRASEYILENVKDVGFDVLKDALKNFVKYLINGIINMFVGILKKALKIISEGFSAIVQSIKTLFSDATPAQKADAITKLLATTVTTYVAFAFEEAIAPYVEMIPVIGPVLKDMTGIIVAGIGSATVVWLIDQADIFSVKSELRTKRIKEVFDMRIKQIKENTDAFEKESLDSLAASRLQFRAVSERLSSSIEQGKDINSDVFSVAEFMHIDLKIKTNQDFIKLLENNKTLEIV